MTEHEVSAWWFIGGVVAGAAITVGAFARWAR